MDDVEWERRMTSVEKLAGSNRHRLDKVEERQDNLDRLVSSVSELANEQKHINDDVSEIKKDVKSLTDKPGKRWDGLVDKILLTAVGLLLGILTAASQWTG